MKNNFILPALLIFLIFGSCTKDQGVSQNFAEDDSLSIVGKLEALGFDLAQGFYEIEDGYIVENDIFFSLDDINYHYSEYSLKNTISFGINQIRNKKSNDTLVRPFDAKAQYRTNELVNYTPITFQTISIFLDTSLEQLMGTALQTAINRYNELPILLRFSRTTNKQTATISVQPTRGQTYDMIAGFPLRGLPYSQILVNTDAFSPSSNRADAASVLAHEIGHCIGLRHTDFMDRRFSCGRVGDEGDAGVGAIHIPGTPTQPEANSFMLACSNGLDRPFTHFDRVAIQSLYHERRNFKTERLNEVEEYFDPFYGDRTVSYDFIVRFYDDIQFSNQTPTFFPMKVRLRYAIGTYEGQIPNRLSWRNMTAERIVPANTTSVHWFRVRDVESYDYGNYTHGTNLFQYQGMDIVQ